MNAHRSTRFSMFLMMALFCFAAYGDGAVEQVSSDLQLKVGDMHLPVFFQDHTLTEAEKNAIVADYQFLLEQLAPQGRRPLEARLIKQDDRGIRIISALLYSARQYRRPRATYNQLGIIGKSNDDKEYIVIQKTLSDGYKASMAIKEAHEEACRSLPGFIAVMNNLDKADLPAVKDFFYLHGRAKKYADEIAGEPLQKIIDAYGKYRYSRTSMLEYRISEGSVMTIMHAMDKDAGSRITEMPVIYHDGRWKIFIALSGT